MIKTKILHISTSLVGAVRLMTCERTKLGPTLPAIPTTHTGHHTVTTAVSISYRARSLCVQTVHHRGRQLVFVINAKFKSRKLSPLGFRFDPHMFFWRCSGNQNFLRCVEESLSPPPANSTLAMSIQSRMFLYTGRYESSHLGGCTSVSVHVRRVTGSGHYWSCTFWGPHKSLETINRRRI